MEKKFPFHLQEVLFVHQIKQYPKELKPSNQKVKYIA